VQLRSLLLLSLLLPAGCAKLARNIEYAPHNHWPVPHTSLAPPQDIRVTTQDGLTLKGKEWVGDKDSHQTIIFFYGRLSDLNAAMGHMLPFAEQGAHVICASYRGFDGNAGRPSLKGLRLDGQAFVNYAHAQDPQAHIILIGHSLGGAVALNTAAHNPSIEAVVTFDTFARIGDMLGGFARLTAPDKWDNIAGVKQLKMPLILIHAKRDPYVPFAQALKLLPQATGKVLLLTIDQRAHFPQKSGIEAWLLRALPCYAHDASCSLPDLPKGWLRLP
jgi:uncharacterized protein